MTSENEKIIENLKSIENYSDLLLEALTNINHKATQARLLIEIQLRDNKQSQIIPEQPKTEKPTGHHSFSGGPWRARAPSGINCIDSYLCVGSLEAVTEFRKNDLDESGVEILDVRSYFDPVTWEPLDSIYRLVDEIIRLRDFGKIGLIHCYAGVDRSPFVACLYIGIRYKLLFREAYKLVKERRPQTTIHEEWLTKMGISKV